MTINARHRKHFKSGSCLSQHELGHSDLTASRKFRRMLDFVDKMGRRERGAPESTVEKITRPEHFERARRSTQSIFGRAMAKLRGVFGGKQLAAA